MREYTIVPFGTAWRVLELGSSYPSERDAIEAATGALTEGDRGRITVRYDEHNCRSFLVGTEALAAHVPPARD
jgi:hypothetical protein